MKKITWNLKLLFDSDDDPKIGEKRKIVEQKSYNFINKWKVRKDYLKDPAVLKQALDEYEQWKKYYGADGDEGYYFWLRTTQDQNDPKLKAKFNKIDEFSKRIENDMQFFTLRIARIPAKKQKTFLDYPVLKGYRHFLERLFATSRYLLSEPEEKILNLKSSTSYANWVKMTSGFIAKEERNVILDDGRKKPQTFSEISSLMNSKNKRVRDSAAKAFNDILHKYVDVAEAEINSVLSNKKVDDELRKIPRPDIARHISDDIDSDIVDALVKTVSERFYISSRYYDLKSRLMNLKKLKYYERNVEYGDIKKKYTYNESLKLIHKVFKNLDMEFADILHGFIKNRQFDVYPKKGKVSGAFCAHYLISQPTYILLNHTDQLRDVLTLAHELGHGINNELIKKKQNALNFGTPTSTAEVASTFMEDFVLQEMLRQADDELRLSLMMMKLNEDVSTIFRQVACYKFEQELHQEIRQKGYLSKEDTGNLFQKHMSSYMGNSVEQSPGSENWWIYWSHIRSFFYVYSYASGLLISKSLQNSVTENPEFIGKVKEFLSAGLSDSPKNIFKKLGVDIADPKFWDKGLDEVEKLLTETITLAEKLGKLRINTH
ncbi:MAG: M3 family oligoendopeptidase [Nitrospirota bacterium]